MSVFCVLATFAALGRLTTWSPTLTSVAVWQCASHPQKCGSVSPISPATLPLPHLKQLHEYRKLK